jgi:hypothetical protein
MRFTFVILLFCCLGADAQMIIKAHPNYVPFASANLLLDDYSNAAAAYSLRKLDKDYTGNAIRVRRSNDNTEQNIGFTASGDLDTASLKTFVGANSGFVTTWYDQSGNARNATQTTAANQPRVVNAGTVERQGSRPTVSFDGSNDNFDITNFAVNITYSIYYIHKRPSTSTRAVYLSGNVTPAGAALFAHWSDNNIYIQYLRSGNGFYKTVTGGNNTTTFNLLEGYTTGSSQSVYLNNSSLSLSSELTFLAGTINWNAIGKYSNANFASGTSSEIILYHSDQSSNRSGINTNINTYYSIY